MPHAGSVRWSVHGLDLSELESKRDNEGPRHRPFENPHDMARSPRKTNTAATLGYEAQLWQMADALRGIMDAAEY